VYDFFVVVDYGSTAHKAVFYWYPRGTDLRDLSYIDVVYVRGWKGDTQEYVGRSWVPNWVVYMTKGEEPLCGWKAQNKMNTRVFSPDEKRLLKNLKPFPDEKEISSDLNTRITRLIEEGYIESVDDVYVDVFTSILVGVKENLEQYGLTEASKVDFGLTVPSLWAENPELRQKMKRTFAKAADRVGLGRTVPISVPIHIGEDNIATTRLEPDISICSKTEVESAIVLAAAACQTSPFMKVIFSIMENVFAAAP
jgi:hypothetical protein